MAVLSYDIAAFAKTKDKSKKESEGQKDKTINMKKPSVRNRKHTKVTEIAQTSGESMCYAETDSITTGCENRCLHRIHSQQERYCQILMH